MEFATLFTYLIVLSMNLAMVKFRYRKWNMSLLHPVNLLIVWGGGIYIFPMIHSHMATDATLGLIGLAMFGLLTGNILYLIVVPRRSVIRRQSIVSFRNFRRTNYAFLLTVLVTVLFMVIIVRNYDLSNFAEFYAKSKVGTAWIYILMNIIFFIYLYVVIVEKVRLSDRRMLIMTVLVIALLLIRGTRTTFITFGMIYVFWTFAGEGRSLRLHLVPLIGVVFFFMAVTTFFRYDYDIIRFMAYFEHGVHADFDNIQNINHITENIERWGYQWGKTLIDAWHTFIPRALWIEKPISTYHMRLIYPWLHDVSTTNRTIGIIGTSYLNFGFAGVLFQHVALAFICCLIYDKFLFAIRTNRLEDAYCYCVTIVYAAVLFNNDGILNKNIAQLFLYIVGLKLFFWGSRKIHSFTMVKSKNIDKQERVKVGVVSR